MSFAIPQVLEPLDGFVCAAIEGRQVPFESSQNTVIDDVIHGVHLAAVIGREAAYPHL